MRGRVHILYAGWCGVAGRCGSAGCPQLARVLAVGLVGAHRYGNGTVRPLDGGVLDGLRQDDGLFGEFGVCRA